MEITDTNYNNAHQFQALFNYATIGIVVTNHTGEIINFNSYAESQFGYPKAEVIGKTVEVLLPAAVHKTHVNHREQYYRDPAPRSMGHGRDLYAQKKDGSTFPVEVSLSHYAVNNQIFVIAFVIDITVRKSHESMMLEQTRELERVSTEVKKLNADLEQKVADRTKMLREALTELEHSKEELSVALDTEKELSELKSRFVTMASHEFRTPLSTILSSTYLLEKYLGDDQNPKTEKHLQRIRGAVAGMKNILEDFLSLGKLEEGLVQTRMEHIPAGTLEKMLTELLQEFEPMLLPGQKLQLISKVDCAVYTDVQLLRNILINLVSNAIKFSPSQVPIIITASTSDNVLEISVQDQGIGISVDDQQHLFERFFRAKNAANIQGTGLGLHIISRYLDLLKGTIRLKSALNQGSTFTITLPNNQMQ
ncbi:PAS domain-containing sensor histidine kinase [Segetibacter sp. 3557_3]|uniref:PAS domain-containing sensor histidine kinase n=1 Tax=Segetibacter sp. 3557_3 TaxID=2547429 RepID=UPI001059021B|nr:PAS domain-containing sensor histidine kinase [Segetibacter sp. 3557_3]TDH27031.1 PAS domain-containing sensor histidine kinase [Segetibacter sp. 3557_3]